MFKINEGDVPFVRTRRALLVLDLQKNLVAPGGITPVELPPTLADHVAKLVPVFRQSGTVIWVKSEFEQARPINDGTSRCENVITDDEVVIRPPKPSPARHSLRGSKKLQAMMEKLDTEASADLDLEGAGPIEVDDKNTPDEPEEAVEESEAFLSLEPGKEHMSLKGRASDSGLVPALEAVVDQSKDMFFTKSYYSAFKPSLLLQTLRSQFVTEIFICGALTNMSVFATAMDAARYGYAITLVDDCLGYRNKARHDQALRSLDEATGCDMSTSSYVIEEIQKKSKQSSKSEKTASKRPVRQNPDTENINQMLEKLKLRSDPKASSIAEPVPEKAVQKDVNTQTSAVKRDGGPGPNEATTSDATMPEVSQPRPTAEASIKRRVPNKTKIRRRTSNRVAPESSESKAKVDPKQSKEAASPSPSAAMAPSEASGKGKEKAKDESNGVKPIPEKPSPPPRSQEDEPKKKDPVVSPPAPTAKDAVAASTPAKENGLKTEEQPLSSDSDESSLTSTEGEPICEGDTVIITDLLPSKEEAGIFERVKTEVQWQRMSHQGGEVPRLVAVQGEIGKDGSIPIYRHPADESPPLLGFSPVVTVIRREVEKKLGHPVNHCLIQLYRSGIDYISEHSDKTLDVVPDTYIANVSLGAQRIMTFRTKRTLKDGKQLQTDEEHPRSTCKAALPHNSLCRMGLMTNMRWLHSIRQDKRLDRDKSTEELDYGGMRISLTFRLIGTFLDKDQAKVWGQGAVAKHKRHARPVVNGATPVAQKMIEAFGTENRSSDFDWPEVYGQGFDALHISNTRKLLLSGNSVVDIGIVAYLAHLGLDWASSSIAAPVDPSLGTADAPVMKLVDNDLSLSTVEGPSAIFLYLYMVYAAPSLAPTPLLYSRLFTRLHHALDLGARRKSDSRALDAWERYAAEDAFIAGSAPSIADFAFWPVLRAIVAARGGGDEFPRLKAYFRRMGGLGAVKEAVVALEEGSWVWDLGLGY
ncbi:hypothetical protein VC83_03076 [Pseudogymnoascus destructans]|uniref:Fe2OG dioxygenase domain-containing protein n=2 Tax=Pseudogymnoascus destructans TaxID=655981 RepID=L8FSZ7_PSED2|nr:uncharacterized protein VC83_03076 [Pseudogymnoascus destructans]ELR02846.1 hypothetical protein GMDG_05779 [Pseudogymnoascus destructans 20631-21]OAF59884.1 hypothetical protein VC83_03076 [Pseudogymnoascus destructans]